MTIAKPTKLDLPGPPKYLPPGSSSSEESRDSLLSSFRIGMPERPPASWGHIPSALVSKIVSSPFSRAETTPISIAGDTPALADRITPSPPGAPVIPPLTLTALVSSEPLEGVADRITPPDAPALADRVIPSPPDALVIPPLALTALASADRITSPDAPPLVDRVTPSPPGALVIPPLALTALASSEPLEGAVEEAVPLKPELLRILLSQASIHEKGARILEFLPPATLAECRAFAALHRKAFETLKAEGGWKAAVLTRGSRMATESVSGGLSFEALRTETIRQMQQFCCNILQLMGYSTASPDVCFGAFGTAGYPSDVDLFFKLPPSDIPVTEETEILIKVLFDLIYLEIFGSTSGFSIDTEAYLLHPAQKGYGAHEFSPEGQRDFTYLEVAFGSGKEPIVPDFWGGEDPRTSLSSALRQFRDGFTKLESAEASRDTNAEMNAKLTLSIRLSMHIDKLREQLVSGTLPAKEKDRLLIQIYIASAIRLTLFDESYKTMGAFLMVCQLRGGQMYQRVLEHYLSARRECEAQRRTFADIPSPRLHFPPAQETPPTVAEGIGSLAENHAMFMQHYTHYLDQHAGASPSDALIYCSKYLTRVVDAWSILRDFQYDSTCQAESQEEYERLRETVNALEDCKRKKQLSKPAFHALIEQELLHGSSLPEQRAALLQQLVTTQKEMQVRIPPVLPEVIYERLKAVFYTHCSQQPSPRIEMILHAASGDGVAAPEIFDEGRTITLKALKLETPTQVTELIERITDKCRVMCPDCATCDLGAFPTMRRRATLSSTLPVLMRDLIFSPPAESAVGE